MVRGSTGHEGRAAVQETWFWDSGNTTEMVMSGVKCRGDEMTLTECQHHSGVSCKRAGAAFAAVLYGTTWHSCDDLWQTQLGELVIYKMTSTTVLLLVLQ
ncbi:hypothetical protein AMELA_G00036610, partial [Ameiurus melas]